MASSIFTSEHFGDLCDETKGEELRNLLSLPRLIFMNQSHSDVVAFVSNESSSDFKPEADALITLDKKVGLAVLTADCLPILVSSDLAVAAIHAGRKGIGNRIIEKTMAAMKSIGADNFQAIIGPSICAQCYEVSPELYREFILHTPEAATRSTLHSLDLRRAATSQLLSFGAAITDVNICTKESTDHYSYRKNATRCREAGVVFL